MGLALTVLFICRNHRSVICVNGRAETDRFETASGAGVKIISCVDNDDAGRQFEHDNHFERAEFREHLDLLGFKDWNEALVFQSINPEIDMKELIQDAKQSMRMAEQYAPTPQINSAVQRRVHECASESVVTHFYEDEAAIPIKLLTMSAYAVGMTGSDAFNRIEKNVP